MEKSLQSSPLHLGGERSRCHPVGILAVVVDQGEKTNRTRLLHSFTLEDRKNSISAWRVAGLASRWNII
jgi:hypothetical protein